MSRRAGALIRNADELKGDLLKDISEGASVAALVRSEKYPSYATIFKWLGEDEGFRLAYEKAFQLRAETMFEEMLEIADNPDKEADVNRDRLRVDTRKWALARMNPRKFGDKVEMSSDPERPLQPILQVTVARRD